jgi:hypothetical protein
MGNYVNNGGEYRFKKDSCKVFDCGYFEGELIKVALYGVYVLNDNAVFVNFGTIYDVSGFVVEGISCWWETGGKICILML